MITVVVVWTVVEGRTILIAATAVAPRGRSRLGRLGWGFLGTETWTLAVVGLAHGLFPRPVHEVFGQGPWGPVVFVAGWMLRDLGLWMHRRPGASRAWIATISLGASAQVLGAFATLAGILIARPLIALGAGAPLLSWMAPPALVAGAVLQWWLLRIRARPREAGAPNRNPVPGRPGET